MRERRNHGSILHSSCDIAALRTPHRSKENQNQRYSDMWKCLLRGHQWGDAENIRSENLGALTPFLGALLMFGLPQICDRTCVRCGKIKKGVKLPEDRRK